MAEIYSIPILCRLKQLPVEFWEESIRHAVQENPLNSVFPSKHISGIDRERLAVDTRKQWRKTGVRLTTGFLDNPPTDLKIKILEHLNAWSKSSNIQFIESDTDPQVRIAREKGEGYFSYLGTDILLIPMDQPTMNLDSFTMKTPESEFFRVVRHEAGHTLGFPHEHMRRELVELIDPSKAIEYYKKTDNWDPKQVYQQVLKPLEEQSIMGTNVPHVDSIMCYQIPGIITKNGEAIIGGLDITDSDYQFAAKVYPKSSL